MKTYQIKLTSENAREDYRSVITTIPFHDDYSLYFQQKHELQSSEFFIMSSEYHLNLPSEINVFSKLPTLVFDKRYNKQMASFMSQFQAAYYSAIIERGAKENLPKFSWRHEDDGADFLQMLSIWATGKAILYFQFDTIPDESSFGIIWNDEEGRNYQTRSGNLSLNNRDEIIHECIDFIYRVYPS